jgi:hypothetical protein
MIARRVIVWAASIAGGAAGASGIVLAFGSNLRGFSSGLFPGDLSLVLMLSIGSLVFIWLDYFLKTEYLRS